MASFPRRIPCPLPVRAALLLLMAAPGAARGGESAVVPSVSALRLHEHLRLLASDAWEGRGTGTAGEEKSTAYVAGQFAEMGLEPAGEQGHYFQPVPIQDGFALGPGCSLQWDGTNAGALERGAEWTPFSISASASAEGPAVFAGYGISMPEEGYDDYEGLDVKGKVVLVFRHAPHVDGEGARGARFLRQAAFTLKLEEATRRGAAALLVFNDPFHFPAAPENAPKGSRGLPDRLHTTEAGPRAGSIPFAHGTLAAAQRVFPILFGARPEECEDAIHAGESPHPSAREGRARVVLSCDVTPRMIVGRNVCGLLQAGAADACDEVLVVGAHHDHLGRGAPGSLARTPDERREIHNGADDNASGVSGLLEVAAALSARRGELRRSILFLTFTGEERGLLGSAYWTEHPTVPLARVAAMLNMDMIGRLDGRKLFIGGVKTSPVFSPILERLAPAAGLSIVEGEGGRAPSDNTSFYLRQIPVLFFFTGLHDDYHRPSDDTAKIDLEGMARVVGLAAGTTLALDSLPDRPPFQRADQGGFGPPRAILGIRIADDPKGVRVEAVTEGGPAEKAGLRAGDVLLALDGTATPDAGVLGGIMRKLEIGARVRVRFLRAGAEQELEVVLGEG